MNHAQCSFEERIAEASRSGNWNDALLAHVAACRSCGEVALVASYLCESSAASRLDADLPSAARIWSKAQSAARAAAIERALRPILWVRRVAFASCAVMILTAVFAAWPRIAGFFAGFLESWQAHRAASSVGAGSGPGNFLLVTVATFLLILLPLVLGLYSVWSED